MVASKLKLKSLDNNRTFILERTAAGWEGAYINFTGKICYCKISKLVLLEWRLPNLQEKKP